MCIWSRSEFLHLYIFQRGQRKISKMEESSLHQKWITRNTYESISLYLSLTTSLQKLIAFWLIVNGQIIKNRRKNEFFEFVPVSITATRKKKIQKDAETCLFFCLFFCSCEQGIDKNWTTLVRKTGKELSCVLSVTITSLRTALIQHSRVKRISTTHPSDYKTEPSVPLATTVQ